MKYLNPDGIKVGDFVVGYHKGVHEVTKVEPEYYTARDIKIYNDNCAYYKHHPIRDWKVGDINNILVHYTKVMGEDYDKPYAKRKNYCGVGYCKKVDAKFVNELEDEYKKRLIALRALVLGQPLPWK